VCKVVRCEGGASIHHHKCGRGGETPDRIAKVFVVPERLKGGTHIRLGDDGNCT
jgi:hypothetical protein